MKKLQPTTQYKKDYKRVKNNPKKLKALKEVLEMLMNEQQIPADYYPHMLQGEYKGCMECHVQGDFLLIWFDPNTDIIELVRLGTHSELFGK
jgi:mRNA interferase YafQ